MPVDDLDEIAAGPERKRARGEAGGHYDKRIKFMKRNV